MINYSLEAYQTDSPRESKMVRKILLIGEEEIFKLQAYVLKEEGYNVNFQTEIEGAMETSRKEDADVVVLGYFDRINVGMKKKLRTKYNNFSMTPDLSQIHLLEEIREKKPEQRVILITTASSRDKSRPIHNLAEMYKVQVIEQPYNPGELLGEIENE